MKKGIILQPRDFEILRTVYEYTVTSFEQLKQKHFALTNVQTASNRLGRLVKYGFIKSYRVGLVIYQGRARQVNLVFTITQAGIRELSNQTPSVGMRLDPVLPQFLSLTHDLLLNEVQASLIRENQNRRCVNSKLMKIQSTRLEQIPDLIMDGENGELNYAIELELTAKSEKRYREIITNYRLSSRWQKVLFITQNDQLRSKIETVIAGKRSQESSLNSQFGKFYFRNLSSLLVPKDLAYGAFVGAKKIIA